MSPGMRKKAQLCAQNIRAKMNILHESERITFSMNEYSNNFQSVFSIKVLA